MIRYVILTVIMLGHLATFAQSKLEKKAQLHMTAYWNEPTVENLGVLEVALDELMEDENSMQSAIPLYIKSQFMAAQVTNKEVEFPDDYESFLDDLVATYNKALIYDENNQNRYKILKNLYDVKSKLTEVGSMHYQEKDFNKAYRFYDAATRINEVEIKFPRIARPDTSTIFTAAVMAGLAGEDDVAIKYFEQVVELGYYRPDGYDQLIRLYKKNKFDVKAKKMEIRKNKVFPPEQND